MLDPRFSMCCWKHNRDAGGAHKAPRIKQATATNRQTSTTEGGASEAGEGEGSDVEGRGEAGTGPRGDDATNGDDRDIGDDSDEDAGVRVGRVVAVERGSDGGVGGMGSTPRPKMDGVVTEGSVGGGLLVAGTRTTAGAGAKGGLIGAGRGGGGEDGDWRGGVSSSRAAKHPGGASKKKQKVGLRARWHLFWSPTTGYCTALPHGLPCIGCTIIIFMVLLYRVFLFFLRERSVPCRSLPGAEADEVFVCFWHVSDCYLPCDVKNRPAAMEGAPDSPVSTR